MTLVLLLAACGGASSEMAPTSGVTGRTTVPTSVSAPRKESAAADVPSATETTAVIPNAMATLTPAQVPTTVSVVEPTLAPTSSPAEWAATRPQELSGQAVNVPDFGLVAYQGEELLGGRETSFSEVFKQGKPVVLNFWAGNCPPCRLEMPSFQAVADKYDGEVVFVGVDVGLFTGLGDHESARQLLDQLDVRYPSAYAVDGSSLQHYKVLSMPTTIFFDSHGSVVARRAGIVLEDELSDIVDQLVAGS
jgi:thiol-disulfide isomerase/thioredoxin